MDRLYSFFIPTSALQFVFFTPVYVLSAQAPGEDIMFIDVACVSLQAAALSQDMLEGYRC